MGLVGMTAFSPDGKLILTVAKPVIDSGVVTVQLWDARLASPLVSRYDAGATPEYAY